MESQPVIVSLAGDYDAFNNEELRRLLAPARDSADAVIDFTATSYVDSSCLTELANVRRSRQDGGLPVLRLVVPSRNMRKIFEIVGFDQIFPLFNTLDEALIQPAI